MLNSPVWFCCSQFDFRSRGEILKLSQVIYIVTSRRALLIKNSYNLHIPWAQEQDRTNGQQRTGIWYELVEGALEWDE